MSQNLTESKTAPKYILHTSNLSKLQYCRLVLLAHTIPSMNFHWTSLLDHHNIFVPVIPKTCPNERSYSQTELLCNELSKQTIKYLSKKRDHVYSNHYNCDTAVAFTLQKQQQISHTLKYLSYQSIYSWSYFNTCHKQRNNLKFVDINTYRNLRSYTIAL